MMPFEKAVDLLRSLSAADYEAATKYMLSLAYDHYSPEKPLTRAEILEDLTISRQQEKEGRHQPAQTALDEVMAEFQAGE